MQSLVTSLLVAVGVSMAPVVAAGQAEKSLAKCQANVGKEVGKYVGSKQKIIAKCLDRIAKERIKNVAGDAAGAAAGCAAGLRKIVNTTDSSKELDTKLRTKIDKVCLVPGLAHSHGDIIGEGFGLTVAGDYINAILMAIPCLHFGGDGSFGTPDEWVDCLIAMGDAQAIRQVHLEYPNADAWLRDVRPDIVALGGDQKYIDAANALDSVRRWVDNGDGTVTDYVTGLMWTRTTDDGQLLDKDNFYTWSATMPNADGTVFTNFLQSLNGATGGYPNCISEDALTQTSIAFIWNANHCDWRLPTVAELKTILLDPRESTCGGSTPCFDADVFGPMGPPGIGYWSATTHGANSDLAWQVSFFNASSSFWPKTFNGYVRAVRGGL